MSSGVSTSWQQAVLPLVAGVAFAFYAWNCWRTGVIYFRPGKLRRDANPIMFPLVVALAAGLAALMLACGVLLLVRR